MQENKKNIPVYMHYPVVAIAILAATNVSICCSPSLKVCKLENDFLQNSLTKFQCFIRGITHKAFIL